MDPLPSNVISSPATGSAGVSSISASGTLTALVTKNENPGVVAVILTTPFVWFNTSVSSASEPPSTRRCMRRSSGSASISANRLVGILCIILPAVCCDASETVICAVATLAPGTGSAVDGCSPYSATEMTASVLWLRTTDSTTPSPVNVAVLSSPSSPGTAFAASARTGSCPSGTSNRSWISLSLSSRGFDRPASASTTSRVVSDTVTSPSVNSAVTGTVPAASPVIVVPSIVTPPSVASIVARDETSTVVPLSNSAVTVASVVSPTSILLSVSVSVADWGLGSGD